MSTQVIIKYDYSGYYVHAARSNCNRADIALESHATGPVLVTLSGITKYATMIAL